MEDTSLMTIREAAKLLKTDRRTIRGLAMGMKIRLIATGGALLMSRADFRRLKDRLDQTRADEAVTV